ncbi:molybdate ABC transporter substrate-binding protein [Vibrio astriarenae]|uniref:Molybdate ABC transporter substrate-binding protein n=1 Tax=Vibrio astriarenae TaxID=1481923 RepID=A0A7Z2YFJ1_9VIBR|nr:molybdate ABC transporter substrate-binding protein [Vibrio astriarenae]QIA65538.1 molybdate ABC transporter substrate-binding protein [Vibrio astriarenae]
MLSRLLVCLSLLVSIPAIAQQSVTVFAAASMTDALDVIATEFEQQTGVTVKRSYASSSVLARQIAQGAPADIYISANERWMDYLLEQKAVVAGSVVSLVENQLVLVMPYRGESQEIDIDSASTILKLLQGTRLAVGDPKHVPAGIYTQQAFESLGMWNDLQSHLARANNVRSALLWVERGEANAGVVYKTDAMVSDKVAIIGQFPEASHEAIRYPIAKVVGRDSDAAESFYQYLISSEAKKVMAQYGFKVD